MIRSRLLLLFFLAASRSVLAAAAPDGQWNTTTWNGEKAFASTSLGWKAVVSLERGRLMLFGPADRDINLLFIPPTRGNGSTLGGHRLWLGPQATWAKVWPPPAQWESTGAESCTTDGGVLRLTMADAGDGWPRLTRTYQWAGARLVCGAEMRGGTRPAQFIQIFQVSSQTTVSARAQPAENYPAGYVQLLFSPHPVAARFETPPQVTLAGDALTLRHTGGVMKLGFRPQTLVGRAGDFTLAVGRGAPSGAVVAEPDEGFFTQVYLSNAVEGFIELEQVSPLFSPGAGASFSVILEAARR